MYLELKMIQQDEELENIVDKMQRNFHCFWQKGYVCRSQQQEWISFESWKSMNIGIHARWRPE